MSPSSRLPSRLSSTRVRTTRVRTTLRRGVVVVLIALVGLTTAAVPRAEARESDLSVLTYNVRNYRNADGTPLTGERSWGQRKDKVAAVLASNAADILALQETTPYQGETTMVYPAEQLRNRLNERIAETGRRYALAEPSPMSSARTLLYNSDRLVQHPAAAASGVVTIGPEGRQVRYATFTDTASQVSFTAVSLHLMVRRSGQEPDAVASEQGRTAEILDILDRVRTVADTYAQGRSVLLGDFNTWPGRALVGDGAAEWSNQPLSEVGSAGYLHTGKEAVVIEPGDTDWATYTGFGPAVKGPKKMDRIYVKGWSRVYQWAPITSHSSLSTASDHLPVKAWLNY